MQANGIDQIFWDAAQIAAPAERDAYLARACAGDAELRRRVERLLQARSKAEGFLESPAHELVATIDQPLRERPGTVIGPYKLLEQIGEGGFGVVFMAEQHEPVQRKVALKVLKPGMDTKQVVARFESERQALALMDHPNIAHVFDGGETASGRPYFVMELVKGLPITRYCDEHKLTPRQRLELFVPVCEAVQHAHQKGVVHRDLKPSNVLAALYDGKPVPKVIDFGVAKAAGQPLTEKTLFTGFGAVVGTLEYMSPEQAELNQLDIDTRSDVYSLGVLLYELLTGTTPLARTRLKDTGLLEALRLIREEETPRPSAQLSTTAELPAVAANRGLEPKKLSGVLRGELDWIVMKALEKDRSRRYETASAFAADVGRYLKDEPVQACPPSAWYRLQKLVRRRRTPLAIAACVLLALAATGATACWALHERARQEDIKRQEAGREMALDMEVQRVLEEADGHVADANWPEAWATVQRAEKLLVCAGRQDWPQRLDDLKTDLSMAMRVEEIYRYPRLDQGISLTLADGSDGTSRSPEAYQRACEQEFFSGRQQDAAFALAFQDFGIDVDALPPDAAAAQIARRTVRSALVEALGEWAPLRRRARGENDPGWKKLIDIARQADPDPWRNRCREALLQRDQQALEELANTVPIRQVPPATLCLLGLTLKEVGASEKAMDLLRRAQHEYPSDFWTNDTLGLICWDAFQPPRAEDALRFYSIALGLRPRSPQLHFVVGRSLAAKGAVEEAIVEYSRAIKLDPTYIQAQNNLGLVLLGKGEFDAAVAHYQKLVESDPNDVSRHVSLGVALHVKALRTKGPLDATIACLHKAIEVDPLYAPAHRELATTLGDNRQFDEMIASCRRAIELDPKYAMPHCDLGNVLLNNKGNLDGAIASYRKAIELDPKFALAYTNLGTALHIKAMRIKGPLDEAIACFRKAIELSPKYARAHRELATTLGDNGQLEEMIPCLREAIAIDPNFTFAYDDLGRIYGQFARWNEARAAFDKADELDPANPWYIYCAAILRLRIGDLPGYRRACRAMLERFENTKQGWVADITAKTCLLMPNAVNDLARVKKLADLAATLDPDNKWFQLVKGLAEYRAGRDAEAVKWLDRLAPRADGGAIDVCAFAVLAMARHRLGRAPDALAALDSAEAILAKNEASRPRGEPVEDWRDWLHGQVLRREAKALLEGSEVKEPESEKKPK